MFPHTTQHLTMQTLLRKVAKCNNNHKNAQILFLADVELYFPATGMVNYSFGVHACYFMNIVIAVTDGDAFLRTILRIWPLWQIVAGNHSVDKQNKQQQ